MTVDTAGVAAALGIAYQLADHGDTLYPPLTRSCFYCHDDRHGQHGNSCPVRYRGTHPAQQMPDAR